MCFSAPIVVRFSVTPLGVSLTPPHAPSPLFYSHFFLFKMLILNLLIKKTEVTDPQKRSDDYCQANLKQTKECHLQLFKLLDVRERVTIRRDECLFLVLECKQFLTARPKHGMHMNGIQNIYKTRMQGTL